MLSTDTKTLHYDYQPSDIGCKKAIEHNVN